MNTYHWKFVIGTSLTLFGLAACGGDGGGGGGGGDGGGGGAGGGGGGGGSAGKTWGTATLIETDTGYADRPKIAVDGAGNAIAVWFQSDGTRLNIWANRYTASSNSWGSPVLIETDNAGDAADPQIAFDGAGNAIAVWQQFDGTRVSIWANRYTASSNSWGSPVLIETDNAGDATAPQIAVDGAGNAIAVWFQSDGTRYNIWANRYTASSNSWGSPVLIETNAGDATYPQIAVDGAGNAIAVWQQSDGTRFNIWANRYTASSNSWGSPVLIETDNVGDAADPQIAFDGAGNAIAVWQQSDGTRLNIWANRYTASSNSWGSPVLIETDNVGNAAYPQIAFDGAGNAIAVWTQSDGTRFNIWANRYTASSNSWGSPVLIETDNVGDATYPQIAVDGAGNAIAVWQQSDGTRNNIWANRYTASSNSWGSPVLIETNAGSAFRPWLAFDGAGNAIAVWAQSDGTAMSIWANRYQ
jgi:hypothetical protein